MDNYFEVLRKSTLFNGVSEIEFEKMLVCLSPNMKKYDKNEYIIHAGEFVDSIGLVLSGTVYVIQEDFWGNRNIITQAEPGQLFAEAFACTNDTSINVSAIAGSNTEIMFIKIYKILNSCSNICVYHSRIIRNLLSEMAVKNIRLNEKLIHITQRSTRDKLLSYLSAEALRQESSKIEITYNRQQLADYLSVDRSAMSNELCKLRDEGIIKFNRNHFELLNHR